MTRNVCLRNPRPIYDTLELVGGKWKMVILATLIERGDLRFGELQRAVGDITPRILSHELKQLEENRMITRRAYDTSPITVEYGITAYGRTLETVIVALFEWGVTHRQTIMHENMAEAQKTGVDASAPFD
ncbi:winged helix-turn-helix transcriptional regulator [Spirosoma aerophilum]